MLDAGAHSLTLNSADIGRCHLAGKMRILREILKITSAERTSLHVHTRTEKDMDILRHCLLTESLTYFLTECNVPAVRYRRGSRETGRFQRLVQTEMIACAGLLADTVRPVRAVHRRNTEARDRPCLPLTLTADDSGFLYEGHLIKYVFVFHIFPPHVLQKHNTLYSILAEYCAFDCF